jgi:hypothetical protein
VTRTYFWQLADRLKPTKTGTFSSKAYVEAECGRFRTRTLNDTYYKGPMVSGKINASSNTTDKDWYYPSPAPSAEFKLKAVCNHKSMQ